MKTHYTLVVYGFNLQTGKYVHLASKRSIDPITLQEAQEGRDDLIETVNQIYGAGSAGYLRVGNTSINVTAFGSIRIVVE